MHWLMAVYKAANVLPLKVWSFIPFISDKVPDGKSLLPLVIVVAANLNEAVAGLVVRSVSGT